MRRTAYLKALEEASKLPDCIPEILRYFQEFYSPREMAIQHIKETARVDNNMFHSELVEILTWKATDAESHDHNTSAEQATSEEDRKHP